MRLRRSLSCEGNHEAVGCLKKSILLYNDVNNDVHSVKHLLLCKCSVAGVNTEIQLVNIRTTIGNTGRCAYYIQQRRVVKYQISASQWDPAH